MTDTTLATAIKHNHQTAYVTKDIEAARAAFTEMFGVEEYDNFDAKLDVVDDNKEKIGEISLRLSFALDRTVELIQPLDDPFDAFTVDPAGPILQFHHVGATVQDVDQAVSDAQAAGLEVTRMAIPGLMEVAFVHLGPAADHYIEYVPPMPG